ncbi:enterobactin exporter EntS [Mycobacteroides abscessus subsp. massiliense]|nr:enterobactin exporter EntS [Mycobacteroides abscessus subsp. massiliense]
MLPLDQLPAANALNMTVQQFGFIAGPLLAGVLLKWVDPPISGCTGCRRVVRQKICKPTLLAFVTSSRASAIWPGTRSS